MQYERSELGNLRMLRQTSSLKKIDRHCEANFAEATSYCHNPVSHAGAEIASRKTLLRNFNVIAKRTLLKQSPHMARDETASQTTLAVTDGGGFFPKEVRPSAVGKLLRNWRSLRGELCRSNLVLAKSMIASLTPLAMTGW